MLKQFTSMKNKWPFHDDDVWSFDDLNSQQKVFAEKQGCGTGKFYFGQLRVQKSIFDLSDDVRVSLNSFLY